MKLVDSGSLYVEVHVEVMTAFASSQDILGEVFLADMAGEFMIKDEGELQRFLAMDIIRSGDSVTILTRSAHSPITRNSWCNYLRDARKYLVLIIVFAHSLVAIFSAPKTLCGTIFLIFLQVTSIAPDVLLREMIYP